MHVTAAGSDLKDRLPDLKEGGLVIICVIIMITRDKLPYPGTAL